MVAFRQTPYVTRQEYLEWEVRQETRHEYHNGVVVAMAGDSPEHSSISFYAGLEIGSQLRRTPCQVFDNDLRVYVPACNKYYYPDKTVVCGEPQYEEISGLRSLLNPSLIVEVLSDSTERLDRREKFDCYETLLSLRTYVLIAQDEPRIEQFFRQEGGTWQYEVARGMEAELTLPAIGCHLRLADVYANVTFSTNPDIDIQAEADDTREQ